MLREAATGSVLSEKVFLQILQNSQENTCARVSFSIKKNYGVQIFRVQEKKTSYTRSETFHKACVQEKLVYIDRIMYAYILYLSDWK